jgi:hypothetical protein
MSLKKHPPLMKEVLLKLQQTQIPLRRCALAPGDHAPVGKVEEEETGGCRCPDPRSRRCARGGRWPTLTRGHQWEEESKPSAGRGSRDRRRWGGRLCRWGRGVKVIGGEEPAPWPTAEWGRVKVAAERSPSNCRSQGPRRPRRPQI